ncbi:hypothetical protein GCM10007424_15680 [Flavobacterium suaedae]|uniref:Uncharacterized protein n=1 Tax=Flavobacterium suaedae TaxID=1767027 RepID=A0ABQ1JT01_9FLAO|nr:hypothetical protein [Flavobacterium suaedae]GGB76530.1 hypothetical protein GCM10007424_15680 [Flavobacterium suaedae]
MKSRSIELVWIATIFIIIFTVLTYYSINTAVLLSLGITGQVFIIYMVYKVLTDSVKTNKTFKDWYEDRPVKTLEE